MDELLKQAIAADDQARADYERGEFERERRQTIVRKDFGDLRASAPHYSSQAAPVNNDRSWDDWFEAKLGQMFDAVYDEAIAEFVVTYTAKKLDGMRDWAHQQAAITALETIEYQIKAAASEIETRFSALALETSRRQTSDVAAEISARLDAIERRISALEILNSGYRG